MSVPEPVFFCSIEPPSLSYQKNLDLALSNLTREDPSLKVRVDSETGQTIMAGMGELHLEVIKVHSAMDIIDNDLICLSMTRYCVIWYYTVN